MNLPNKLTMLRIVMIPLFLLCIFIQMPHHYLWALLVFGLASLTDMADGMIARKRGLVTDFGVLMDPLADKLLVMSAMICFIPAGIVHAVVVILILSREFLVTSIRLVAAGKGSVIAADKMGKLKTISQMIWICLGLLWLGLEGWAAAPILWNIYQFFTGLVVALTVASGINYTVKNRSLFADA
ncbi:MAG: CDP-diacylglycerol--glycerol-3-phosphate 3-phosphatidyltransferase [Oscillospiraceae bacterium]